MKKALIVIDMQIMPFLWKDYGGKALYKEQELLENTKFVLQKARRAKAPIYYILYTETGNSPRAENQPLWHVHPEIIQQEQDVSIVKYHADSFLETDLEQKLKQDGISDLVICGVQTEYCVDTTVRSAYAHGFTCELACDAHSTYDMENLSAAQIIYHHNFILSQFASIKPTSLLEFCR